MIAASKTRTHSCCRSCCRCSLIPGPVPLIWTGSLIPGLALWGMLFTDVHRDQLNSVGFTRVPGLIPTGSALPLLHTLKEFSFVDWSNPATWYSLPESYLGIIPSHHHQAQWDFRQHPRLHEVFSALWGTQVLWVTIDRIGFVPPLRPARVVGCSPRINSSALICWPSKFT